MSYTDGSCQKLASQMKSNVETAVRSYAYVEMSETGKSVYFLFRFRTYPYVLYDAWSHMYDDFSIPIINCLSLAHIP